MECRYHENNYVQSWYQVCILLLHTRPFKIDLKVSNKKIHAVKYKFNTYYKLCTPFTTNTKNA